MSKQTPQTRSDYLHIQTLPTRWRDNDIYGHVNNVVYYEYFDTAVNRFLIDTGHLIVGKSDTLGLVVETGCSFFAPIAFPQDVTIGLRVAKLGTTSVRYEIGLFIDDSPSACAQGHFIHVYVDAVTRRPKPLSAEMRATLQEISS